MPANKRLQGIYRNQMKRTIKAPTGTNLTCQNWLIEAAYRMIQNDLALGTYD